MNPTTWDAPYPIIIFAMFCIVMARANGTYWLGRSITAGLSRSRKAARLLEGRHYVTATRWLNRWGAPAITVSFMTIGIQTMINLAAGVTKMPLRRYLPAVTVGCIIWAFIYGSAGFLSLVAVEKLWQRSPALVIALGVLAVAGVAWAVLRKDKPSAVAHQGAAAPEPQAN